MDKADKTYADGLRDAAALLKVSQASIRLAAGEMTAGEMRSVQAVLAWRARVIINQANAAAGVILVQPTSTDD